ncbi:MAG TPA: hypothetical protein VM305_12040 [Candidatus Limnocylindrales bacterium]|nr:hypothetical protein [Candidatus Limnocylindrales bacterium]
MVDTTARRSLVRTGVLVGGRPAPPPPPAGPISRVQSGLVMRQPAAPPAGLGPRVPFGLPSLRRNVCSHFYMTGPRGRVPLAAPHLLKALMRQESNVARCQLRGGVHLEQSYVSDICLSPRFNQCVFYEDELTGP